MKNINIVYSFVFLFSFLNATIIDIPGDYTTIQDGINIATEGDTVLVADGTYYENLTVDKKIVLASHFIIDGDISHRDNTIIDGSSAQEGSTFGSCVLFLNSGTRVDDDVITEFSGFTVSNGRGTRVQKTIDTPDGNQQTQKTVGGGMMILNTYPVVTNNRFKNNGNSGSENRTNSGGAVYGYEGTGIDFDETRDNWSSAIYQVNRQDSLIFADNIFDDNWAESGNSVFIEGFETTIDLTNGFYDVYSSENEAVSDYWVNSDNSTFDFGNGAGELEAITVDVYVSTNGSDVNDGSDSSPFLTIGYAMSMIYGSSDNPVTIHLDAGIYSSTTNGEQFPVTMVDWISLIGAGEETTILDGEGNSTVLIFENTENASTELLTITNGSDDSMGSVFCSNASPTILDITIKEGDSYLQGGGMVCQNGSNPIMTRVTFSNNVGYTVGGLLCGNNSSPVLTDCSLNGNTSENNAGGMLCYLNSNPHLDNVSISNNSGYQGGGLVCRSNSNPTLSGCTISNNTSTVEGGGLLCYDNSNSTIENSILSHNNAYRGGGIFVRSGSDLFLTNVVIDSNIATHDNGGGIFIDESLVTFSNVTISNNTATLHGGGVFVDQSSSFYLSNASIVGNNSIEGNGGGIYLSYVPSPTLSDLTITGNSSIMGAGIYFYFSENSNASSITVGDNIASHNGGGICFDYSNGSTLTNSIVSDNDGLSGGGIFTYFSDNAQFTNCEISGNTSNYNGGGINFDNSEHPTCEGSEINNNNSTNSGGGVYIHELAGASFIDCEINENITANNGGAVFIDYATDVTFTTTKFNNNNSTGNGGGIYSYFSPGLSLIKFEMTGNTSGGQGGGLFFNYTESEIINGTIVNNIAEYPYDAGGGVLPYYSETEIINTILWDNNPSQIEYDDYWGTGTNVTYSDIQGGWSGTGNIDSEPLFVDSANSDFALSENSPCIDTGTDVGLEYIGSTPDMGAYESNFGEQETTTQTIQLSSGWNWFSINVDDEDMSLDSVLSSIGESATVIKNQTGFATYYEGFGWYGLDAIDVKSMYMISMLSSAELNYTGNPIDFVNTPITLSSGWNWIGYLPQVSNNLNDALDSIGENADVIKCQTEFATYYDGFGWYGMDSMNPGDGYMISMNSDAELIYGIPEGILARNDDLITNYHWLVNPNQFEHNMTITANVVINEIQISEVDQLGVFVNSECRGVAIPTYFPLTDSYTINLMTYGDDGDELRFRVYQQETNKEIELLNNITFEINGIVGNDIDPILLKVKQIPEEFGLSQNFPNPFNPSTTINYQLQVPCSVLIDVYDINGKLVATLINGQIEAGYHSVTWNAEHFASGVYIVRLKAGDFMSTQKILLMK